jgi:hypothetical protein
MKLFIAHRGNTNGPCPERENEPGYINEALEAGFDVEVDVWVKDHQIFTGHDAPQWTVTLDWLSVRKDRLWCHAKNLAALEFLLEHGFHAFSHDEDPYVLTSRGIIWAFPGRPITARTVCVMPERASYSPEALEKALGICSDFSTASGHSQATT